MELTQEQQQQVAKWVRDGMSLSDLQQQLRDQFGLNVTYMEVRFLIDDLDVELKDAPSQFQPPSPNTDPVGTLGGSGSVVVTTDKVVRAGSIVSGSVTFSDGARATWYIDAMGRLGLNPEQAGYSPSQEDIATFQEELHSALKKAGFQ